MLDFLSSTWNITPSSSSPVEVVGMLSGPLLSVFPDQPDWPKATDGLPLSHTGLPDPSTYTQ